MRGCVVKMKCLIIRILQENTEPPSGHCNTGGDFAMSTAVFFRQRVSVLCKKPSMYSEANLLNTAERDRG